MSNKFCVHEKHGGFCERKRTFCNPACPYEEIKELAPVVHGSIIETIEDGHMKRVFSCCGTDFRKMTCWMTPKYCPNCGAKMDLEAGANA